MEAEIRNIEMYESFLKEDLPEDVRIVFENKKRASESHLRAFENASEGKAQSGMSLERKNPSASVNGSRSIARITGQRFRKKFGDGTGECSVK